MAWKKKSKFNIFHFLFSILFMVMVGGGAWYFAKIYKPPTKEYYLTQAQLYTEGLMAGLGVSPEIQESKKWIWIDEDGKKISLIGYQFLLGTTESKTIGVYGKISPKHLEKINNAFFAPLLDDIDIFFEQSRFVNNEQNQQPNKKEPHVTLRAYQRNKIKCLIRLTAQSDPFGVIFCGIYSLG